MFDCVTSCISVAYCRGDVLNIMSPSLGAWLWQLVSNTTSNR